MKKYQIIAIVIILILVGGIVWYRNRNALTPPINAVTFVCDGGKTIDAQVEVRPQALGKVALRLSDRPGSLILNQTISASGARYANADESFVFWNKGDTAFIEENGSTTFASCVITK